jgi:DNA polymerase III sliding clamp (beta) subunit (PCNA family)
VIVEDFTTAIQASLLSGEYVNYPNLMVESGKMEAKFNLTDFEEAVKMAMVSAADGGEKKLVIIKFEPLDGIAKISARSDRSEADASIPCEAMGCMEDGTNEIAFNGQYLLDAIKAGKAYGEETKLMLNKAVSPMVITPMNRDDYYQLVLPVRRLG